MKNNYSNFIHDFNLIIGAQYEQTGRVPLRIVEIEYIDQTSQYLIHLSRDLEPIDVSNVLMQLCDEHLPYFDYTRSEYDHDAHGWRNAVLCLSQVCDYLRNDYQK